MLIYIIRYRARPDCPARYFLFFSYSVHFSFVKIIQKTPPLKLAYLKTKWRYVENIAEMSILQNMLNMSILKESTFGRQATWRKLSTNMPQIGRQYDAFWVAIWRILQARLPSLTPLESINATLGDGFRPLNTTFQTFQLLVSGVFAHTERLSVRQNEENPESILSRKFRIFFASDLANLPPLKSFLATTHSCNSTSASNDSLSGRHRQHLRK